jgi:GH35 family endo-1,4-beta-xylanase
MKIKIHTLFIVLFFTIKLTAQGQFQQNPILETKAPNAFPIADATGATAIYVDDNDLNTVKKAVSWLQHDVELVSGQKPNIINSLAATPPQYLVIVGSLDNSTLIKQLVADNKIKVDSLKNQWEAYQIQVVDKPMQGVEKALVIVGSDRRGTAFGVFDLSQMMGVSPWYWWADVPVAKRKELYVRGNFNKFDKPVVKYRGFFINDEAPALSNWSKEKFGGFNAKFYEHVFELTLRLKGNYHWPAMWGNAFYDDDKNNGALADEYGIVMGTSHHEPLGRAHDEWRRYGKKGIWNYEKNDSSLRAFWKDGVERIKNYDKILSVGMRGDGDAPMSRETATALLEKIVTDQRKIITDVTGKSAAQTPQLWALYKEVQDYYDKGMRVDDDITLLLCDDNWGNIRKLPKLDAPKRAGGYGIYYHFDYVGGPRNYKWLNTNNIARVWEQMHLANSYGANQIWIVNVGDIKPMEFPLNFFMDYAWNPERMPAQSLRAYTEGWVTRQFGAKHAPQIAEILRGYANINARRKPELLSPETYSLAHYREAETLVEEYRNLEKQADAIYADLPSEYKDAYYQLVLFPVKACANMNDLYVNTAKNRLYAQQGRVMTNDLAKRSEELYKKDAALTDEFHTVLAGGKWNNMMSQTHIGYTYWQQPKEQKMPEQKTITPLEKAEAGLSVEGLNAQNELPEINTAMPQTRYFELFNKGTKPFDFIIKTKEKALKISAIKGTIATEQRIEVSVDAAKLKNGKHRIPLSIETTSGQKFDVFVTILKPEILDFYGFIEVDKTISIEAEHSINKVEKDNIRWQVIPDIGRKGAGVTTMPVTAAKQTPSGNSPHLTYKIWVSEAGEATVTAYLSPSLSFNEAKSLQYAISIDDETPQIKDLTPDVSNKAWEKMVADNCALIKSKHTFKTAGAHILNYWLVDAGVVLQKITVTRGDEKPSYLGAPETRVLIQNPNEKGLKDYYKKQFPIGVAVSPQLFEDMQTTALIKTHFSSMTPENVMKMGPIHPEENRYNWLPADKIVDFAQKNGILLRGHNLCWHSQTPTWFFKKDGNTVTKEELLARLKTHITDVVTHYKGKIYVWDVVNEAVPDGSDKIYRESDFYKIIGEEYIEKAFEYAHAADPKAKLFYNDYNTENASKRERIYQLLKKLKEKGVPIHGVGLQGHWSNFEPSAAELEASITKFASLGLEIQFTEVDVSVYPKRHEMSNEAFKNKAEYTLEMEEKQTAQYKMLFEVFRKHKKVITSVTFWNLSDKSSWLDNFPVRGRKDFPLLFDQNHQPKKAYWKVIKF